MLLKHLNDPLPLPRSLDPKIPEPLEAIALKAVTKEPAARYQTAEEMASALRRAAVALEITLPKTLPRALSFSTEEAPAEPVAVFSGGVREQLTALDFADDETDVTLGEALEGVAPFKRGRTGEAILGALLITFVGNLLLLTLGGISGNLGAFGRGWPMQLWLVGAALAFIMVQVGRIWLVMPVLL